MVWFTDSDLPRLYRRQGPRAHTRNDNGRKAYPSPLPILCRGLQEVTYYIYSNADMDK